MTIVSDSNNRKESKTYYKPPVRFSPLNWLRVSRIEDKFLALISFGFFYDFRNMDAKPKKAYTQMIDKILDIFEKNIDTVEFDEYYITYEKYSIWIANTPYAVYISVDSKNYGMTFNQIARVLTMKNYILYKKI